MKIPQRNVATKQMKRYMKKQKQKTKNLKDVIIVPKEYKIWTENQMAQTTVGDCQISGEYETRTDRRKWKKNTIQNHLRKEWWKHLYKEQKGIIVITEIIVKNTKQKVRKIQHGSWGRGGHYKLKIYEIMRHINQMKHKDLVWIPIWTNYKKTF